MINHCVKITYWLLVFGYFSLANVKSPRHISEVFMGCFPCDTRLEAFPPYLSRVRTLARLFSGIAAKNRRRSRIWPRRWMSQKGWRLHAVPQRESGGAGTDEPGRSGPPAPDR